MSTLKYSRQRESIKQFLATTKEHPTADCVYLHMKKEFPNISLGTVYRNLAFFQQNGQIQSVGVVQGQERFDGIVAPHSHFICNCCGTVMDLPEIKAGPDLDGAVSWQYGLTVQRHELTFYGLCSSCANQQQNIKEEPPS